MIRNLIATLFVVVCFTAIPDAFGQTGKMLTGIVKDNLTGDPIDALKVSIRFGESDVTVNGMFKISLQNTNVKAGERLTFFTYNEKYGSSQTTCTISNDYQIEFSIPMNPAKINATGIIKNAVTRQPIEGIELIARSDVHLGAQTTPVFTDRFGIFSIPLSKTMLRSGGFIQLFIRDPQNRYSPSQHNPENVDMRSSITLELQPRRIEPKTIQVSHFLRISFIIETGKHVTMEASGNMELGQLIGTSGPEGKQSGVLGFSLNKYNIVPSFNHGALMYRISGDRDWKLVGNNKVQFTASRDCYIEFEINDNKQNDNSGAYTVDITQEN
jgi:hypothetical protein